MINFLLLFPLSPLFFVVGAFSSSYLYHSPATRFGPKACLLYASILFTNKNQPIELLFAMRSKGVKSMNYEQYRIIKARAKVALSFGKPA